MDNLRRQRLRLRSESEHASRLARVDSLTGLGNRRAFDEAIESAVALTRRTDESLSIAVLDVDGFKAINDTHGHLKGDQCLRQVAAVLRDVVRRPDACFRWGGDEFAVLLAGVDRAESEVVSERILIAVTGSCVAPDGTPLTLKAGTAQLAAGEGPEDLVAAADSALLTLKALR